MGKHEDLTQKYSTWGDKLLQHCDVLDKMQQERTIQPITVQLAPCEVCDSKCPFCSVGDRPLKSFMPWPILKKCIEDFYHLGAKSVEITGGGNPMLYRDKDHDKNINDIIELCGEHGLAVGLITNSHDFSRLDPGIFIYLDWIRVSLIKLDEGVDPKDYNFFGYPYSRLAFSYIIYDKTSAESIRRIGELVEMHPEIKFVRLAGDCLLKGANVEVQAKFRGVIDAVDRWDKFFLKDIWDNDDPFPEACYVGMIRPYVAPDPKGTGDYYVYACTSHVLEARTYNLDFALCRVEAVIPAWEVMNDKFVQEGYPYEIRKNGGKRWCDSCKHCFYYNNNKLLHTVATELPDKEFA